MYVIYKIDFAEEYQDVCTPGSLVLMWDEPVWWPDMYVGNMGKIR